MALARSSLLFVAGGDCFAKYSTLTRRLQIPTRRGEDGAEVFTRTTKAWSVGPTGLLVPAAINAPRVEYIGGLPYYLGEAAATNVALRNRDCANAAWTKTTCTAVRDQVGADGVVNAASSLLATAGNATCLQAIVLGSSARFQTVYVKRLVGAGTIQMTMDNGATWTAIAVTAAYGLVSIPTQTLANPTVGFRLVTNGDKIAVDFVQNEAGTFATSPIDTTTVAVTRATDSFLCPFPYGTRPVGIYCKFIDGGTLLAPNNARLWQLGTGGAGAILCSSAGGGTYGGQVSADGSAFTSTTGNPAGPAIGNAVETLTVWNGSTVAQRQSIGGAADVIATPSGAAATLPATWSGGKLWVNDDGTGAQLGRIFLASLKVFDGTAIATIADARAIPI